MSDERHVTGLADLQKFMRTLPEKMEKNVMRGALRAGMNVVKPIARANAAKASGLMANGLRVGTKSKGTQVWSYLRAAGPHGFLARWFEFTGARAHFITGRGGDRRLTSTANRLSRNFDAPGWLTIGNTFTRIVSHPGFKARPFMRPALDSQATPAVVAAAEYMKKRLATKHGLDTAGITIEGDE